MVNFRNKRLAAPVALLVSLMLTTTVALVWGSAATSAAPSRAAAAAARPVAEGPGGELRSRIVGETANGREVNGKFVPLNFTKRNGKVFVRGLVQGVVHKADGSTARTFGVMRTVRVKSIEGTPIRTDPRRCPGRGLRHPPPGARTARPRPPRAAGPPQPGGPQHRRGPGSGEPPRQPALLRRGAARRWSQRSARTTDPPAQPDPRSARPGPLTRRRSRDLVTRT